MKNSLHTKKLGMSGQIVSFFSGVAKIKGLASVFLYEVLLDSKNVQVGIVIGFDEEFVDALFFDDNFDLKKLVYRSNNLYSISLSDNYIGRIIDGLGMPIDGLGNIKGKKSSVFQSAPQIIDREPVTIPLVSGIKVIDTSLPLGRGQRELIIGDRKIGKSAIALDIVLNQKKAKPPVKCVYVICGQTDKKLKETIALFRKENAFLYTTIVAATAGDSLAAQFLAPFVGCAIAEYFRDKGEDVLIVYDDLSKHAKVYRDVMLLLEKAPGREAYPGDIFSLHALLLERSAKLSKQNGGGSLSALPIVETQEGDIASFIPTNLISITDGQIYLESGLFQKGFLPAINVGLSVSRVGSKAQSPLLREVVGGIRLALSQHKELQKLVQLETTISEATQNEIYRGDFILELLKQDRYIHFSTAEQVVLFYAAENGLFDSIDKKKWKNLESFFVDLIRNQYSGVLEKIDNGEFSEKIKKKIQEVVDEFKQEFIA